MDISTLDIFVLLALADGPLHGYAVMQDIRARGGRVSTGSFYRRLSLLMKDGLVEEAAGPATDDPRRSVYYRITARGRQALVRARDRMAALVAAVDAVRVPSRGRRA